MAAAKKRKRKKGGRKLEFAIYIAGVVIVALLVLGVVKLIQGVAKPDTSRPAESNQTTAVSDPQSDAADPGVSSRAALQEESSSPEISSLPESHPDVSSRAASSQAESSQAAAPVSARVNGDYVAYTKSGAAELDEWYLLLVNPWHTISSSWQTGMTYIDGEYCLDSRIIPAYRDMVAAAAADGINIYPISCYRSYETQTRLYNNRVDRAKRENPSFSQKEAEDYAATHVARPGTSEHQTGLAIDFNSVEQDFGATAAGKWLYAHCNEYGFIMRYDSAKQNLTGVIWEPWHFRFVGVKHAKRMTQLGMCLEEYVEYIKGGGQ